VEPNWYPTTPTTVTTTTPASRPANTYFGLVEGGSGGSGSRSGASASLLRRAAIEASPANASRCLDRFQGGSADSGAAPGGAASPFAGAPGFGSGSGCRTFFGA